VPSTAAQHDLPSVGEVVLRWNGAFHDVAQDVEVMHNLTFLQHMLRAPSKNIPSRTPRPPTIALAACHVLVGSWTTVTG
jgi:hypothetical protein